MALAANALTSLARVLDELGLTSDAGAQDARLERYIDAESQRAASFCNRVFQREDAIAETHAPRGGVFLHLRRTPVVAVTSVTVNGGTLQSTDYTLRETAPGFNGKLYRSGGWGWPAHSRAGITYGPIPGTEEGTVVVTYNGGWVTRPQSDSGGDFEGEAVTLPTDLEDAIVQMVATRWKSRDRDRSITEHVYENQTVKFGGVPIPPEAVAVLKGYRRIVVA